MNRNMNIRFNVSLCQVCIHTLTDLEGHQAASEACGTSTGGWYQLVALAKDIGVQLGLPTWKRALLVFETLEFYLNSSVLASKLENCSSFGHW